MRLNFPLFVLLMIRAVTASAQACIDSTLIDPMAFCPMIWDPVCGCNGVTYGNYCEAEVLGGVTSFTYGECTGTAGDCLDLGMLDFGDCEMAMGVGILDGNCSGISGCGWVIDGVDYSIYSFESIESCLGSCGGGTCQDLNGIDFGVCTAVMGIAILNGSCTALSGCGWVVDGIDYSVYSFETMEACESSCGAECMDLEGIDFGACDMVMGPALIGGMCSELSGCGWVVNGIDYSTYSFESVEACQNACGTSDCIDPTLADPLVDCSPFDPEPVCGCDSVSHLNPCFATYVDWVSTYAAGACAGDCFDESRVNLDMACDEFEAPVCGCDGVTYQNACQAWHFGGLAQWVAGPCETNAVLDLHANNWTIGERAGGTLMLNHWPKDAAWTVYGPTGQLLGKGKTAWIDASAWRGLVIVQGPGHFERLILP